MIIAYLTHDYCMLTAFLLLSRYPRDAPLVCFSTPASQFPKSASLNVTRRLMEEARAMALDQGGIHI